MPRRDLVQANENTVGNILKVVIDREENDHALVEAAKMRRRSIRRYL